MSITIQTTIVSSAYNGWLINDLKKQLPGSVLLENGDLWVQTQGDSICDLLEAKAKATGQDIMTRQSMSVDRYETVFVRRFTAKGIDPVDVLIDYKVFIGDIPMGLNRKEIVKNVVDYLELYDTVFVQVDGDHIVDSNSDREVFYQYSINDRYSADATKIGADINIKILERKDEWFEYERLPF